MVVVAAVVVGAAESALFVRPTAVGPVDGAHLANVCVQSET